ncbi:MAG TPA: substrate-binding domain-containing protein [Anaerolineales bacterium]|nr:substrate-binding domain-containing protein [Anaerolineales bacterium]
MQILAPRHPPIYLRLAFIFALCACGRQGTSSAEGTPAAKAPAASDILLATTTSTQDSGLLDVLVPAFEQSTGYVVKVVAVGTGQALKMGEEGNADVLLVHAPESERSFMEAGFGADRWLVMHNDFVIVGPTSDPAEVRGASLAADAFRQMAAASTCFISRGDDSGTHKMELRLWEGAALTPAGDWYQESGQGMAATLRIAAEKGAYTLTDRATYLALRSGLDLVILVEGDPALLNIYHVITVSPERWPDVNAEGARAFAEFLVSAEGQALIGEFGLAQFGGPLFVPDAGKVEQDLGSP